MIVSASNALDFSQELGNSTIDLGFREFGKQSWEFYEV